MNEILDRAVRQAAEKHLSPFDVLQDKDLPRRNQAFHVAFKYDLHHEAVSLTIMDNGTFTVGGSTTVVTETFVDATEAYARANAFVKASGIQPAR